MRRVVVTGVGLVTPLGCGNGAVWEKLLAGQSGISLLQLNIPNVDIHCAGHVTNFDLSSQFNGSDIKHKSKATLFALHASDIALQHSAFVAHDRERVGVAVACGIGSLQDITDSQKNLDESYKKVSPYFVSKILINMPAGEISIKNGFQGPNHAVATGVYSSKTFFILCN